MIGKALTLLVLVSYAASDSCVRFTFEDNEWLTHAWRECHSMPFWVIGKYVNVNLTPQNEHSTSYIRPLSALSCISSFNFSMNYYGTIEVNIHMEASDPNDQISVIAFQLDSTGDRVIGVAMNSPMDPNFVSGWDTLRMTLTGSNTYDGYISIMGMASPNSKVLVDSFRYIPPGMDERDCKLYEGNARNHYSRA